MILSYAMEQLVDAKDLKGSTENSSGELTVSALRFVSVFFVFRSSSSGACLDFLGSR